MKGIKLFSKKQKGENRREKPSQTRKRSYHSVASFLYGLGIEIQAKKAKATDYKALKDFIGRGLYKVLHKKTQ